MSYKWWLAIAVLLFAGRLALGVVTPANIGGLPAEDVSAIKKLAEFLAPLPRPSILTFILIKNISAILLSLVLSPFFCFIPIMALALNGWLLGFVSATVVQEKSLGYLLSGVLPHGIFELPALIIGEAVALSFGTAVMLSIFGKGGKNLLLTNLRKNLRYLIVSVVLLLIAAIIETYITPLFLR